MNHLRVNRLWLAYFFIGILFLLPNIWLIYFNQNYVYPKRCVVDFMIALAAFALALEKNLILPEKRILYVTGGLLVVKVFATLLNPSWVSFFNLGEGIGFGILCVYFMTIWRKHEFELKQFYWFFTLSSLAICALALWQFVNYRMMKGDTNPLYFSGPFGNINMMVEFLIFLLPMAIYFLQVEKGYRNLLIQFIITTWIFFILVGQSRSALLGLIFIFGYGIYRRLSMKEWGIAVVAVALYIGTWAIPSTQKYDYSEAKKSSLMKRFDIYKGTLSMLADHPLGVGGSGFEFSYMPYQMGTKLPPKEDLRYDSPHNEFIKWGIENGWLYLAGCFLWWFLYGIAVWRIKATSELMAFYRTSYFVVIPQMLFQFPFDNPGSFAALSFIFAVTLSAITPRQINFKNWAKIILVGLAIALSYKAFSQTKTRWIESQHFTEKDQVEYGCSIDRTNWRVCFYYAYQVVSSAYPDDALPVLKRQLHERPFDFLALRVLGFYYMAKNQLKESCEVAYVYNTIFSGVSFYTPYIESRCRQISNPVPFIDSAQFNDEYRVWIAEKIK